ncbi:hypothetical protein TNCV_515441 [Trichonephila clavipes]|nr:hypothetical protein TNCV_515441 [Trichonephila clavipes]
MVHNNRFYDPPNISLIAPKKLHVRVLYNGVRAHRYHESKVFSYPFLRNAKQRLADAGKYLSGRAFDCSSRGPRFQPACPISQGSEEKYFSENFEGGNDLSHSEYFLTKHVRIRDGIASHP